MAVKNLHRSVSFQTEDFHIRYQRLEATQYMNLILRAKQWKKGFTEIWYFDRVSGLP